MGAPKGIQTKVYKYLVDHKNTEVHVNDIVDATGFTYGQVIGGVNGLRNSKSSPQNIDSPRKGWYVFRGSAKNGHSAIVPHKAKAEVIALVPDGDRLLVTVEGVVGVWAPLDLPDVGGK